jgi:hypothetical protein
MSAGPAVMQYKSEPILAVFDYAFVLGLHRTMDIELREEGELVV